MSFPESCKLPPFAHQIIGVNWLVRKTDQTTGRIIPNVALLADEMRLGKTKQCIDAAQILFERGEIDNVIVVTVNSVRSVWYDPELGEIHRHLWDSTPAKVSSLRNKVMSWTSGPSTSRTMRWYVTNYEHVRTVLQPVLTGTGIPEKRVSRYDRLMGAATKRTVLILDESSAVQNYGSQQTKACLLLRKQCGWVWELNGTPVSHSPKNLFSQAWIMDKGILECQNFWHFRGRYAILGGWKGKQIVDWKNLDDLQRRLAPYVLRRLKKDCLDIPPKLPPVTLSAQLEPANWKLYKELRDEFVHWLDSQTVAVAAQAGVRAIRLAQITSGVLGGITATDECPRCKDKIWEGCGACDGSGLVEVKKPFKLVGREKLDMLHAWYETQIDENPELKLIVWCRFVPELERAAVEFEAAWTGVKVCRLYGNQDKEQRLDTLRTMDPRSAPKGAVVMFGTPSTGSMGLDLSAATSVLYLSNDRSLKNRLQSEDRPHGPLQTEPVAYYDVIAEGPDGQKTVDHIIIKALHERRNLAEMTCSAWVSALKDEE